MVLARSFRTLLGSMFVLFIVLGCSPSPTPTPLPPTATPTTSLPTLTLAPTAVPPTRTLTPTAIPPTLTPTLMPVPPTATPKPPLGFQINGKPFKFLGAFIPGWFWGNWSEANDVALITQARQAGITVFHLMPPLYENPLGTVHEDDLRHLDHFMDVASQNDLYVMFLFTGGLALSTQTDLPFSNPDGFGGLIHQPELRAGFKQYMAKVITRVNSINGRKYSEDPTILSWIIIDEFVSAPWNYPHGLPNITAAEIADWVQENASYIKTLDRNHLVSIQTTATTDNFTQKNQDWRPIFTAPALDFVEAEDAEARIRDHPEMMEMFDTLFTLNKPIVIMLAYDSGAVDQNKYCTDYQWQADATRQLVDLYLAKGAAGFSINYWQANTYASPPYDLCYGYSIDNTVIVNALKDVSGKLGKMNVPPHPLDFVRLSH